MQTYYRFQRCDKRAFDRAFREGRPVSIVKNLEWARGNDAFVGTGFTRETVADPYVDGPSRPCERWFYWVADLATTSHIGPVEWRPRYVGEVWREGWGFHCALCDALVTEPTREEAEDTRKLHEAAHERGDDVVVPLDIRVGDRVRVNLTRVHDSQPAPIDGTVVGRQGTYRSVRLDRGTPVEIEVRAVANGCVSLIEAA